MHITYNRFNPVVLAPIRHMVGGSGFTYPFIIYQLIFYPMYGRLVCFSVHRFLF